MFVDDSGRRRLQARLVGGVAAAVVFGYVVLVALTFAGAPGVGELRLPGLAPLSQPGGDAGADVGPGANEQPLPAAVAPPPTGPSSPVADDGDDGSDEDAPDAGDASTTEAPTTVTTGTGQPTTTPTTAPPGQGSTTTTTAQTPNSTVPDPPQGPPPSHGPPTSRPPRP